MRLSSFLRQAMSNGKIISVDFEVFGRVQGVFFRKYTKKAADSYGLVGWCLNSDDGTVKGQIQGNAEKINEMKNWLREIGSPSSKIEKAVFGNEKEIEKLDFKSFSVKH